MATIDSSNSAARVQQLLLLVWVHGFVGDESTFADFPEDVCEAAKTRFTSHDVHSIFYPTYKTVGELDVATEAFVVWLHQYVLDLETEQVDRTDRDVHTTVILLGHSMGGMLVADAAKMVHDQRKKDPNKERADVRGVIAMDTPFIGIHPALVSYGMEQIDAYIDKTLLDTAAFFENSPKFLKNGMKRIGITTDKPKTPPGESSDPGRLTKGFTSVLALPGKVSSAEWDWTSESRGGGWKGLKRVISGQKAVVEVDEETEERIVREKREKRERKEREKEEKRVRKEVEKREKKEREENEKREKEEREGKERKEEEEREDREKREKEEWEAKEKREKEEREERERREKLSEEERKREDEEKAEQQKIAKKDDEANVDTPQAHEESEKPVAEMEVPPIKEIQSEPSLESTKSALVPPPLPPRRIISKPEIPSVSVIDSDASNSSPATSTSDLALHPTDSSMTDPTTLDDQSPAAKQAQQKKNWKWVRSHMQFMSSCWSVGEISRRMKGIDNMQKEGMYFVNVYTIVKPDPPTHLKDRTFVSLPTIHHPTKDSWKPFIHDSASDQVEAHMALFDRKKHKGYGRLIGVICDEIEEVLKRCK